MKGPKSSYQQNPIKSSSLTHQVSKNGPAYNCSRRRPKNGSQRGVFEAELIFQCITEYSAPKRKRDLLFQLPASRHRNRHRGVGEVLLYWTVQWISYSGVLGLATCNHHQRWCAHKEKRIIPAREECYLLTCAMPRVQMSKEIWLIPCWHCIVVVASYLTLFFFFLNSQHSKLHFTRCRVEHCLLSCPSYSQPFPWLRKW